MAPSPSKAGTFIVLACLSLATGIAAQGQVGEHANPCMSLTACQQTCSSPVNCEKCPSQCGRGQADLYFCDIKGRGAPCGAVTVFGCFPSSATVQVKGRGVIPMEQLKLGDAVLSRHANGSLIHMPIYMFAIAEADPMRHVRELTTEAGPVLKLSEFHFLPICQTNCDEEGSWSMTLASLVQPGDYARVLTTTATSYNVTPSKIISTTEGAERGKWVPFVRGDLVVNGVVASPYPVTHRILDATPASMLSSLPALYHAMTLPIWEQYQQIGSHAMAEKQAQYQPLVTAFLGAGSLTAGLASHDDSITT